MVNAVKWLTDDERKQVEEAIGKAEKETRCEFVCAISTRSAAYHPAIRWWSLIGGVLGFAIVGTVDHLAHPAGNWAHVDDVRFVPSLLGMLGGFFLAGSLFSRVAGLLTMFTNAAQQNDAVDRAASYLYGKHQVSHTEERVGVLFYLSLMERKLVVMADRAVSQHLGQEGLEKLTNTGTAQLKEGNRGAAFVACLEQAAELLKETFPYEEGDENELQDHLIAIHPHP